MTTNEDNTVFVVQQALKRLKCHVPAVAIKDFLLRNPCYPSLKSVCDALSKCGIEHYALKLNIEEIKELELPFIIHLNQSEGKLALVEKIYKDKVIWRQRKGETQISDFENFVKRTSGVVILIEPRQKTKKIEFRQKWQNEIIEYRLLPLSVIAILLFVLYSIVTNSDTHFSSLFIVIMLNNLLGFTASIFLVLNEFKIHTHIGDKICGLSSRTDCGALLTSSASRLFGNINWADVGIIYFFGVLLYLIRTSNVGELGALVLLCFASLPYPIFSIYHQVKLNKYCPFCLVVQLVLVVNFFILLPVLNKLSLSVIDLIHLTFTLIIPTFFWITYKLFLEKQYEFNKDHYSLLKIKRESELFIFLLKKNKRLEFTEKANCLEFGNSNASVTVTAFLSLYCNTCEQAFKKLKTLIENCTSIRLNVVLSINNDSTTQKIINALYYLYETKGADASLAFLDSWYSSSTSSRNILLKEADTYEHLRISEKTENSNKQLFETYEISGIPTIFIDGFRFPHQYDYSDIEYYIEDIVHLTKEYSLPICR